MSEDNVRDLPLSPQALITMAARIAESFKPAALPDPELTLWDEVVRMRLGSVLYVPGEPPRMRTAEEAIDDANKVAAARRAFKST